MNRGDLVIVNFDPIEGSDANKVRPAIIVSNDAANQSAAQTGRGVITVVPVTKSTVRIYPFQVLLLSSETGLRNDSKAQAEQIRAVSVNRIGDTVGRVSQHTMKQLEKAILLHLDLQ